MKKLLLTVLFGLSLVFSASSQTTYPKVSDNEDTIWISSTIKFVVEQKITLGTGTADGGDYKYIKINQAGFTHAMTATNNHAHNKSEEALDSRYTGKTGTIIKIKTIGGEKHGYNYQLILNIDGMHRHQCDIVQAIKCGEIECDGCETKNKNNSTTIINNQPSMADELLKIKKLKDDGILTEEEYQAQKTKILNK